MTLLSANQIPLPLQSGEVFRFDGFIDAPGNRLALELVQSANTWHNGAALIVGPGASGKSHLLHALAQESSAQPLKPGSLYGSFSGELLIVDDFQNIGGDRVAQELMFHLLNRAMVGQLQVLMASRLPLSQLDIEIPDLQSRLAAASTAIIEAPDDAMVLQLLTKHFSEAQVDVKMPVIEFCAQRIDRTYSSVARTVTILNSLALSEARAITIPLAKEALGI